jgi:NAD(P)-dependent dehydrogenase (short-subunit alcohol dehydrogenase family)
VWFQKRHFDSPQLIKPSNLDLSSEMTSITLDSALLSALPGKTVIITGAANGIGAETARTFHRHGANVVIADLPMAQSAAEELISSLSNPSRAIFVPANILVWSDMLNLFNTAIKTFGKVDVVVANAGLMESKPFFQLDVDEAGQLKEPVEAYRVIDVNLKGTLNSKSLATMHLTSASTNQGQHSS